MTPICPEGHESESTDYCDTCGSPIGAGPSGGAAPVPGMPSAGSSQSVTDAVEAGEATQTCPHCGSLNVADALFCEACGYDFTTGTPPLGSEPEGEGEEVDEPEGEEPEGEEPEGVEPEGEEPEGEEPEGEPEAAELIGVEEAGATEGADAASPDEAEEHASRSPHIAGPDQRTGEELEEAPQPAAVEEIQPILEPEPAPGVPAPSAGKARHTPPSRALSDTWVVEMWVDPDWYAVQQTEEACPSAGVPDIVLLTRSTALVGRPSGSLGVRPDIDAGADSAVSRRHAQLTSDGRRWWIEDLGSSNGTFVGRVAEPMPSEPVPQGQRVEIDRDDRIYVGAWTRLVLRQATESEKRGEG